MRHLVRCPECSRIVAETNVRPGAASTIVAHFDRPTETETHCPGTGKPSALAEVVA